MSTAQTFIADVSAWASSFPQKMDALARQVSQEMSERVIEATPVDTGFLRSSWQPSIGQPQAGQGAAGAQGTAVAKVTLTATQMQAGDLYYLINNANYAEHVEYGTSKMQGRFMVNDNAKRWPVVVEKVAKDLGMI